MGRLRFQNLAMSGTGMALNQTPQRTPLRASVGFARGARLAMTAPVGEVGWWGAINMSDPKRQSWFQSLPLRGVWLWNFGSFSGGVLALVLACRRGLGFMFPATIEESPYVLGTWARHLSDGPLHPEDPQPQTHPKKNNPIKPLQSHYTIIPCPTNSIYKPPSSLQRTL